MLLAIALGVAAGRATGRSDPGLRARIDTVLLAGPAAHDTIIRLVRDGRLHADSSGRLVARIDSLTTQLAFAHVLRDSLLSVTGDTGAAYASCTQEVQNLWSRDSLWRLANRQCAIAVGKLDSALTVAEGRLSVVEPILRDANRELARSRRAPKWTALALWGTRSPSPIGAELQRHAGPFALAVQVRWDSLQVLGGVGLRF